MYVPVRRVYHFMCTRVRAVECDCTICSILLSWKIMIKHWTFEFVLKRRPQKKKTKEADAVCLKTFEMFFFHNNTTWEKLRILRQTMHLSHKHQMRTENRFSESAGADKTSVVVVVGELHIYLLSTLCCIGRQVFALRIFI